MGVQGAGGREPLVGWGMGGRSTRSSDEVEAREWEVGSEGVGSRERESERLGEWERESERGSERVGERERESGREGARESGREGARE